MATEIAAPSPAAKPSGDGNKTAANVSTQQAVQRFVNRAAEPPKSAPQTADTTAPEAPASSESSPQASQPSAAEQANASSPEPKPAPAEAPEKTAPEGEAKDGEADDVLSPESQTLDQKTKEKIQRRIDKEVGKRKALEGQIELLQRQMTSLAQQPKVEPPPNAQPPKADSADPLPDIKDDSSLKEYRNQAKQTVRWAEELLDREDIDQGVVVGKDTYTKAQIKGILRNARVALEDVIPAKMEYLQEQAKTTQTRSQITQAAHQNWPFLAEQNNPEVAAARQFIHQAAPEIAKSPAYEYILGGYVAGVKALITQQQAAKKNEAAPEPKAAPAPPAPPEGPERPIRHDHDWKDAADGPGGCRPRRLPWSLPAVQGQGERECGVRRSHPGRTGTQQATLGVSREILAKERRPRQAPRTASLNARISHNGSINILQCRRRP